MTLVRGTTIRVQSGSHRTQSLIDFQVSVRRFLVVGSMPLCSIDISKPLSTPKGGTSYPPWRRTLAADHREQCYG